MAITPRIISNIVRPNAEVSEYWSGTDSLITDKQQINVPTTSEPITAIERLRERQRQQQEQQAVQPEQAPQQNEQTTVAPEQPVIDPNNPPLAP